MCYNTYTNQQQKEIIMDFNKYNKQNTNSWAIQSLGNKEIISWSSVKGKEEYLTIAIYKHELGFEGVILTDIDFITNFEYQVIYSAKSKNIQSLQKRLKEFAMFTIE
jgi:hypothetical protein